MHPSRVNDPTFQPQAIKLFSIGQRNSSPQPLAIVQYPSLHMRFALHCLAWTHFSGVRRNSTILILILFVVVWHFDKLHFYTPFDGNPMGTHFSGPEWRRLQPRTYDRCRTIEQHGGRFSLTGSMLINYQTSSDDASKKTGCWWWIFFSTAWWFSTRCFLVCNPIGKITEEIEFLT